MSESLIGIGVACVIAAIVGGGLEAAGMKFPVLNSIARQVMAAAFGLGLCVFGFYYDRLKAPAPAAADRPAQESGAAGAVGKTDPVPKTPDAGDPGARKPEPGDGKVDGGELPAQPTRPAPVEDISGLWNDANGAIWKLEQDGSKFTFAPPEGYASTHGNGEIDGKAIMLRAWINGVLHTCNLTLSGSSTFITGPCQSTGPGNPQFQVRWTR